MATPTVGVDDGNCAGFHCVGDELRCGGTVESDDGCPACLNLETPFCYEFALAGYGDNPLCGDCISLNGTHVLIRNDVLPDRFNCGSANACVFCTTFGSTWMRLTFTVIDGEYRARLDIAPCAPGEHGFDRYELIQSTPFDCLSELTLPLAEPGGTGCPNCWPNAICILSGGPPFTPSSVTLTPINCP